MPRKFFVSYRRDDSQGEAGRFYDRLENHFGASNIFMDVDSISPGLDFLEVIKSAISQTDVLFALIGPRWIYVIDELGERRINSPDDLVASEIAEALQAGIPVVPVLLNGTRMPRSQDLPEQLAPLTRRHAVTVDHSTFHADVTSLLAAIDRAFPEPAPTLTGERATADPDPAPESVPGTERPLLSNADFLDDVRKKRFRMARKAGYEVLEVDQFIDEVETAVAQRLAALEKLKSGQPAVLDFMTLSDVENRRFRMARKSGYEVLEVDEFVDDIQSQFAQQDEDFRTLLSRTSR